MSGEVKSEKNSFIHNLGQGFNHVKEAMSPKITRKSRKSSSESQRKLEHSLFIDISDNDQLFVFILSAAF